MAYDSRIFGESTRFAQYEFQPLTIFLSYGHDCFAPFAIKVRDTLRERGHDVWFDAEKLIEGFDWQVGINDGITKAAEAGPRGRMCLLLTPHAVRKQRGDNPCGYCIHECSMGIQKKMTIQKVKRKKVT